MTTAYTSLLGLALPVTGELSGTWGDTVNNSITSLLDTSVAGTTNVSTDTDVTLTTTTGAANTARQAILLFSGARTALRTVTAPAQSKIYTVINATTGGFSVKLVGSGPTTGVTIVAGESAVCAWNGSDFIKISNTGGSASFTNVTVTGTTTLSGLTASTALALDASKNVVSVTNTGTGNNVLSASPTLTGTIGAASLTLSTDLTLSGGTANGVTYLNGSKVLTSGSDFTFDGTYLTLGATQYLRVQTTTARANITIDADLVSENGLGILSTSTTYGQGYQYVRFFNSSAAYTGSISQTASTGIGLYSASDLLFGANSAEGMRLTSTGLGIGTSSPSTKLTVRGVTFTDNGASGGAAGLVYAISASSGGNFGQIGNTGTRWSLGYGPSLTALGTEVLVWDSSGNVGIGTSSPAYKLDVNGTSNITTTASGSAGDILGYQAFSAGVVGNHDTGDAFQWKWAVLGASGGGGTGLNTRFSLLRSVKSQLTNGETLTVDSLGYFGINTANATNPTVPRTFLDVRGANVAIGVTALDSAQGQAFIGTSTGWGQDIGGTLALGGTQNSGTLTATYASISGRRESSLGYIYTGYMQFGVSDGTNVVERMRITSAGDVGIGTNNPQNTLDVRGGATVATSTGAGTVTIGTSSGRAQYQYVALGGQVGGTDYGWQVGRSSQGGVVPDGFYIYDIKGNATRLVIDLSGNVGIGGTTSPAGKLQVGANGSAIILDNVFSAASPPTTGNDQYIFRDTNDGSLNFSSRPGGGGNYKFWNGATQLAIITNAGNVGIGTSNPLSRLHMTGVNTFAGSGLLLGSAGVSSGYIWTTDNLYIKPNATAGTLSGTVAILNFAEAQTLQFNSGNGSIGVGGANATTSGTGITFPATQSASSDANTLDDYEEGTFTATLRGNVSDPTTPVTTTGYYTKVGNVVTVIVEFNNVNTTGASGEVSVTGFPFTVSSSTSAVGNVMCYQFGFNGNTSVCCYVGSSTTTSYAYVSGNNSNWQALIHSAGTNRYLWMTITYRV
jgi:hypothetical protein